MFHTALIDALHHQRECLSRLYIIITRIYIQSFKSIGQLQPSELIKRANNNIISLAYMCSRGTVFREGYFIDDFLGLCTVLNFIFHITQCNRKWGGLGGGGYSLYNFPSIMKLFQIIFLDIGTSLADVVTDFAQVSNMYYFITWRYHTPPLF